MSQPYLPHWTIRQYEILHRSDPPSASASVYRKTDYRQCSSYISGSYTDTGHLLYKIPLLSSSGRRLPHSDWPDTDIPRSFRRLHTPVSAVLQSSDPSWIPNRNSPDDRHPDRMPLYPAGLRSDSSIRCTYFLGQPLPVRYPSGRQLPL